MTIAAFDLVRPRSVVEASQLLEHYGDDAKAIAGGTTLVILMKQRVLRFSHLIDLQSIPGLDGISETNGWIHIGALATHRSVECSSLVRERVPVLAQAFGKVGNVRLRETASVGGNLAHADYRLDPPPALLILNAEVVAGSAHGTRTIPLTDFYTGAYETILAPGEILTEVRIPPMTGGAKASYLRYGSLSANDWPCLGVAVSLAMEDNRLRDLRLAMSGMADTPLLIRGLEVFRNATFSEDLLHEVSLAAEGQTEPTSDIRGSAGYKRHMARVLVKRILKELSQPFH